MLSHADKPKQHAVAAGRATGKHMAVAAPGDAQGGQGRLRYADRLCETWAEPECEDSGVSQSRR